MRASQLLQAGELGGILEPSGIASVLVLLTGTAVLVVSVELLIRGIVRTAIQFQLSAFMLAILFSGVDFDNFSFGLFTAARELENVAFGLAIGNPISVLGITLALGALLFPFDVDVPREYLLLFGASPFAILPLLLLGSSSMLSGVILLVLFVLVFGYIVRRERRADRVFMQSDEVLEVLAEYDVDEEVLAAVEDHDDPDTDVTELLSNRGVDPAVMAMVEDFDETEEEGTLEEFLEDLVEKAPPSVQQLAERPWFWPAVLFVAIVGIVAGGEAAAAGAEGILKTWNLSGTFLGVTFITILYTIDDTMLVVEPLRLGYNDIAIGGVLGVFLFNLTATVGMISVLQPITFRPETLAFHFPVLLTFTGITTALLWRGRIRRWHGALLLGLYVLYIAINVRYLAMGIPVPE